MKSLEFKALSKSEKKVVLAARPKKLRKLDEDELLDLHRQARRARDKYATLHRRRANEQVGKDRARGKAGRKHARVAAKAEVFEDVLSRVSRQLAVAARRSSEELKAARLAAAGTGSGKKGGGKKGAGKGGRGGSSSKSDKAARRRRAETASTRKGDRRRSRDRTPAERRRVASERATKRRQEARRR